MSVRISRRARDDIAYIYAYLSSRQGTEAGEHFLALAEKTASFLAANPEAGPRPRCKSRHKLLRFWVISQTNFLIYYLADESGVSVERVLDGRRDVKRIIERELEEPKEEDE
jgi:plasmid stabilization system protein ParE